MQLAISLPAIVKTFLLCGTAGPIPPDVDYKRYEGGGFSGDPKAEYNNNPAAASQFLADADNQRLLFCCWY